jgi:hypothetical protein
LYRANKVGKIDLPSWLADLQREILNIGPLIRNAANPLIEKSLKESRKNKKLKYSSGLKSEILKANNSYIAKSSNKSKAAWQVINKTVGNVRQDGLIKEIRTAAGALASDNVVIANTLNSEFIVPVPSVVEIPDFPDYNVLNALFLTPVSEVEVMHFIKQLPNKRSCGYDGIPIFL